PFVSDSFVRGLKCRLCNRLYPIAATNFCEDDFGPLEVDYDYDALAEAVSRAKIEARPFTMWRYQEFLPLEGEPTVGFNVGGTPLLRADRLAAELGVERLWVKNDAVNFPTLSFKDRVVSVALSKAKELGLGTWGGSRWAAPRRPPSPPASPPTPPRSGCRRTSSCRPTWSGPRCSAPASSGRRSSRCAAPTTR